ncbi:glycosyltransferase family 2 protein [bacterium]|nr:glycosyltransferase family 2 protein [bacterium]
MERKIRDDVFVVVPAYNEAKVIRGVVENLLDSFEKVVVVNDGSSDGTAQVLEDMEIAVINHMVNLGQGAALQTGISYVLSEGAEWIITFDSDGQHRVEDALRMLDVLQRRECDVVLGSRFLGCAVSIPRSRMFLLRMAIWFFNLGLKTPLTDTHNGLRIQNRKAAEALNITQNGMAHATEIISQLSNSGMRIRELPVTINYTEYSLSKGQSSLNSVNILIDLLVGRFLR